MKVTLFLYTCATPNFGCKEEKEKVKEKRGTSYGEQFPSTCQRKRRKARGEKIVRANT